MNIQPNHGLLAFRSALKIGSHAPTADSTPQSFGATTGSAATSDKVTISNTAKALAESENNKTTRTSAQENFLQAAGNDTDANVDKLAYEMAYAQSRVAFDISHGDIRLASTGQVVGDDDTANFDKLAAAVDAQQRALYDSEKAKGTDPKEILAKIIDFRNAQSDEYRVGTAWGKV